LESDYDDETISFIISELPTHGKLYKGNKEIYLGGTILDTTDISYVLEAQHNIDGHEIFKFYTQDTKGLSSEIVDISINIFNYPDALNYSIDLIKNRDTPKSINIDLAPNTNDIDGDSISKYVLIIPQKYRQEINLIKINDEHVPALNEEISFNVIPFVITSLESDSDNINLQYYIESSSKGITLSSEIVNLDVNILLNPTANNFEVNYDKKQNTTGGQQKINFEGKVVDNNLQAMKIELIELSDKGSFTRLSSGSRETLTEGIYDYMHESKHFTTDFSSNSDASGVEIIKYKIINSSNQDLSSGITDISINFRLYPKANDISTVDIIEIEKQTLETYAINLTLSGEKYDIESGELSYYIHSLPNKGIITYMNGEIVREITGDDTLIDNNINDISYIVNTDVSSNDFFSFYVEDVRGLSSDIMEVSFNIFNYPYPSGESQNKLINSKNPGIDSAQMNINLADYVIDIDNDLSGYKITNIDQHMTLTVAGNQVVENSVFNILDISFIGLRTADNHMTDGTKDVSFTFQAFDSRNLYSQDISVNVTISNRNPPDFSNGQTYILGKNYDEEKTWILPINHTMQDVDTSLNLLRISILQLPSKSTLKKADNSNININSLYDFNDISNIKLQSNASVIGGHDNFRIKITDESNLSAELDISLNIRVNPKINDFDLSINKYVGLSSEIDFNLSENKYTTDYDEDGIMLYKIVDGPTKGVLKLNTGSGYQDINIDEELEFSDFRYIVNENESGTDSFKLKIIDQKNEPFDIRDTIIIDNGLYPHIDTNLEIIKSDFSSNEVDILINIFRYPDANNRHDQSVNKLRELSSNLIDIELSGNIYHGGSIIYFIKDLSENSILIDGTREIKSSDFNNGSEVEIINATELKYYALQNASNKESIIYYIVDELGLKSQDARYTIDIYNAPSYKGNKLTVIKRQGEESEPKVISYREIIEDYDDRNNNLQNYSYKIPSLPVDASLLFNGNEITRQDFFTESEISDITYKTSTIAPGGALLFEQSFNIIAENTFGLSNEITVILQITEKKKPTATNLDLSFVHRYDISSSDDTLLEKQYLEFDLSGIDEDTNNSDLKFKISKLPDYGRIFNIDGIINSISDTYDITFEKIEGFKYFTNINASGEDIIKYKIQDDIGLESEDIEINIKLKTYPIVDVSKILSIDKKHGHLESKEYRYNDISFIGFDYSSDNSLSLFLYNSGKTAKGTVTNKDGNQFNLNEEYQIINDDFFRYNANANSFGSDIVSFYVINEYGLSSEITDISLNINRHPDVNNFDISYTLEHSSKSYTIDDIESIRNGMNNNTINHDSNIIDYYFSNIDVNLGNFLYANAQVTLNTPINNENSIKYSITNQVNSGRDFVYYYATDTVTGLSSDIAQINIDIYFFPIVKSSSITIYKKKSEDLSVTIELSANDINNVITELSYNYVIDESKTAGNLTYDLNNEFRNQSNLDVIYTFFDNDDSIKNITDTKIEYRVVNDLNISSKIGEYDITIIHHPIANDRTYTIDNVKNIDISFDFSQVGAIDISYIQLVGDYSSGGFNNNKLTNINSNYPYNIEESSRTDILINYYVVNELDLSSSVKTIILQSIFIPIVENISKKSLNDEIVNFELSANHLIPGSLLQYKFDILHDSLNFGTIKVNYNGGLNNNSFITTWKDRSINNYNISINNDSKDNPILNLINSKYFVNFSENNSLTINNVSKLTDNFEIYLVYKLNTIVENKIISVNNTANDSIDVIINFDYIKFSYGNDVSPGSIEFSGKKEYTINDLNEFIIYRFQSYKLGNNNYIKFYKNNQQIGNTYEYNLDFNWSDKSAILYDFIINKDSTMNGDLGELIMFNTEIDSNNNKNIMNYLINKWDISINDNSLDLDNPIYFLNDTLLDLSDNIISWLDANNLKGLYDLSGNLNEYFDISGHTFDYHSNINNLKNKFKQENINYQVKTQGYDEENSSGNINITFDYSPEIYDLSNIKLLAEGVTDANINLQSFDINSDDLSYSIIDISFVNSDLSGILKNVNDDSETLNNINDGENMILSPVDLSSDKLSLVLDDDSSGKIGKINITFKVIDENDNSAVDVFQIIKLYRPQLSETSVVLNYFDDNIIYYEFEISNSTPGSVYKYTVFNNSDNITIYNKMDNNCILNENGEYTNMLKYKLLQSGVSGEITVFATDITYKDNTYLQGIQKTVSFTSKELVISNPIELAALYENPVSRIVLNNPENINTLELLGITGGTGGGDSGTGGETGGGDSGTIKTTNDFLVRKVYLEQFIETTIITVDSQEGTGDDTGGGTGGDTGGGTGGNTGGGTGGNTGGGTGGDTGGGTGLDETVRNFDLKKLYNDNENDNENPFSELIKNTLKVINDPEIGIANIKQEGELSKEEKLVFMKTSKNAISTLVNNLPNALDVDIDVMTIPSESIVLYEEFGYKKSDDILIVPSSIIDENKQILKKEFDLDAFKDKAFYVPLQNNEFCVFKKEIDGVIQYYDIKRKDSTTTTATTEIGDEIYYVRVMDISGTDNYINLYSNIDLLESFINEEYFEDDKANFKSIDVEAIDDATKNKYNRIDTFEGDVKTEYRYYKSGIIRPGYVISVFGDKLIINGIGNAENEKGTVGDPFIFPLNTNIPMKLPDKRAYYRLYEQGNNYINAYVDKATNENKKEMIKYARKFTSNIKDIITDGYFYKRVYIFAEGNILDIDLTKRKLNLQQQDFFTIKKLKNDIDKSESKFKNKFTRYQISWTSKIYGTIKTTVLFYENPNIENGIIINPNTTKYSIGLMVKNYIPSLMEIPKLNTRKYNRLYENIKYSEDIYENKSIKPKNEKWIYKK